MISFVAHLPSVIFTRRGFQGRRTQVLVDTNEELGKTVPTPINPWTGKKDEGLSRPTQIILGRADQIVEWQDKIKEIKWLEKKEDGYVEEIEDIERDVARWEREAKRIKDKLRKALASHSSITADIKDVKAAIEDVKKQMSSITGSGSQSLEDDLRYLENQRIDLERDLKYSWQTIEQLQHELWGVNQLKQSHQKRIDTALGEISRLKNEIRNLKKNLPPDVNEILVDMQTKLIEGLELDGVYPNILDDPAVGPLLRAALTPTKL